MHQVRARPAGIASFIARDVPDKDMDTVTYNDTFFIEDPTGHIPTPTNHGLACWNGTYRDVIDAHNGLDATLQAIAQHLQSMYAAAISWAATAASKS